VSATPPGPAHLGTPLTITRTPASPPVPVVARSTPTATGGLASTGADPERLAWLAALLVVGGLGTLGAAHTAGTLRTRKEH
jgi:hypothetical protein